MARVQRSRPRTIYRDAGGRVTPNPAEAVTGEVVDVGVHDPTHRARFFLQREELPWLPVTEVAFLLWVLAALVLVWIAIAVGLLLV